MLDDGKYFFFKPVDPHGTFVGGVLSFGGNGPRTDDGLPIRGELDGVDAIRVPRQHSELGLLSQWLRFELWAVKVVVAP